jgi:hypothetical protein
MCGGGSSSNSTSQAANSTTVNDTSNVNFSVNTTDLANAIQALAGANLQGQELQAATSIYATQAQESIAKATAGPSWSTIIYVAAALIGVAFTLGFIRVPKGL